MRITYKEHGDEAELVRIWDYSDSVIVPKEIEGRRVTSIAPYAFSAHKDVQEEEVLVYEEKDGDGILSQEEPLRCGGNIREIHLPQTVRVIGNYAFYGCMNLELFHATDRIVRMGSGVFTGCRLSRVRLDFYDGEKSCLKEILTEIRYEVTAVLSMGDSKAKVVFPEFYADAVENTPARIVETHYYGSGGDYRECFYRRELDFQKYDSMFILSAARDQGEVTAAVALGRLMYPYRLSERAKSAYEEYVRSHMKEITEYALTCIEEGRDFRVAEPMEALKFCCRSGYYSQEMLGHAIEAAALAGETELLSMFMDERQRCFPKRKKEFIL